MGAVSRHTASVLPKPHPETSRSDLHERRVLVVEGVGRKLQCDHLPNSFFRTNPVCPPPTTPENSDPALKQADCQQSGPWVQQLFDSRSGGLLRGGAGKWPQKPSVAVWEWGYLPCPLRWALISACGMCAHMLLHADACAQHAHKGWCRSWRGEVCVCGSWWTNEVCL